MYQENWLEIQLDSAEVQKPEDASSNPPRDNEVLVVLCGISLPDSYQSRNDHVTLILSNYHHPLLRWFSRFMKNRHTSKYVSKLSHFCRNVIGINIGS